MVQNGSNQTSVVTVASFPVLHILECVVLFPLSIVDSFGVPVGPAAAEVSDESRAIVDLIVVAAWVVCVRIWIGIHSLLSQESHSIPRTPKPSVVAWECCVVPCIRDPEDSCGVCRSEQPADVGSPLAIIRNLVSRVPRASITIDSALCNHTTTQRINIYHLSSE